MPVCQKERRKEKQKELDGQITTIKQQQSNADSPPDLANSDFKIFSLLLPCSFSLECFSINSFKSWLSDVNSPMRSVVERSNLVNCVRHSVQKDYNNNKNQTHISAIDHPGPPTTMVAHEYSWPFLPLSWMQVLKCSSRSPRKSYSI